MVYTDYIRLINSYLPDVLNPAKFFVPDLLTRVPITYLGRIINVKLLDYNTMFDMALGVLSLGIGAAALARYARRETKISYVWFLFILFVYYSLNKWEMLTNGTGWVCFLSISGFYCHYLVLDRAIRNQHSSRTDRVLLMVLPSLLTLLVAGPYCGSYSAILCLVYFVMIAADYRDSRRHHHKMNRLYPAYLLAVLIPLLFYLWSNTYAVYVHRGAVEGGSLIGTLMGDPVFFLRLLLKAFASAVVGMAQLMDLKASGVFWGQDAAVCFLGMLVICLYLYALFLTLKHEIYKKTVFPLILILNGGLNHLLIVVSRWIFLDDTYGMSPRYMIQYQMGIIGIMLTFAIVWNLCRRKKEEEGFSVTGGRASVRRYPLTLWVMGIGTALILAGNIYTTRAELIMAPYRKIFLKNAKEVALNYKNATDEDLETYLQSAPENVRKALNILEENHLNLFGEK